MSAKDSMAKEYFADNARFADCATMYCMEEERSSCRKTLRKETRQRC